MQGRLAWKAAVGLEGLGQTSPVTRESGRRTYTHAEKDAPPRVPIGLKTNDRSTVPTPPHVRSRGAGRARRAGVCVPPSRFRFAFCRSSHGCGRAHIHRGMRDTVLQGLSFKGLMYVDRVISRPCFGGTETYQLKTSQGVGGSARFGAAGEAQGSSVLPARFGERGRIVSFETNSRIQFLSGLRIPTRDSGLRVPPCRGEPVGVADGGRPGRSPVRRSRRR